MWALIPGACFVATLASAGASGLQTPSVGSKSTAGDVIVKFAQGTDADQQVQRAAAHGDAPGNELSAHIAALGKELGVPLNAKRVGSGGTVLVAIVQADLPATIVEKLRERSSVRRATRVAAETPETAPQIRIDFMPGSDEAAALGAIPADITARRATASRLAADLGRALGVPLDGEIDSERHLLVTVSLDRMAMQLASQLGKRPDVQYAQPNHTVRPYGVRF
jgi:phosphohistidine swiveling domain-containing protein